MCNELSVNDQINAHFQIHASYLINVPSMLLKLFWTPFSNRRSL